MHRTRAHIIRRSYVGDAKDGLSHFVIPMQTLTSNQYHIVVHLRFSRGCSCVLVEHRYRSGELLMVQKRSEAYSLESCTKGELSSGIIRCSMPLELASVHTSLRRWTIRFTTHEQAKGINSNDGLRVGDMVCTVYGSSALWCSYIR